MVEYTEQGRELIRHLHTLDKTLPKDLLKSIKVDSSVHVGGYFSLISLPTDSISSRANIPGDFQGENVLFLKTPIRPWFLYDPKTGIELTNNLDRYHTRDRRQVLKDSVSTLREDVELTESSSSRELADEIDKFVGSLTI
jgi:hypothetical protein